MSRDEIASIEASLRRRFRVVETSVSIAPARHPEPHVADAPQGRRREGSAVRELSILHPESAEDLIDEGDFERDERLPYWAELWPSSVVMSEHLLGLDGRGKSVIELGCGSGLVATCASLAGFDVAVSDYYEDALRFARVNAARNAARVSRALLLDWRQLPPGLPTFDVVVASDVLYERSYGPVVAKAIAALLRPSGTAIVADPGRVGREEFIRALGSVGLEPKRRTDVPFARNQIRQTITLFEIARRG